MFKTFLYRLLDLIPPYRKIQGLLVGKETGPDGSFYILIDGDMRKPVIHRVFGVDQSEIDIERCQKRLPSKAHQFQVVNPKCEEDDYWFPSTKFKIITSFQTLYYLNDIDLQKRLISLNNMLENQQQ